MIPTRVYTKMWPGQTKHYVTQFDPIAVGMINRICEFTGAKIVTQSTWRRGFAFLQQEMKGIENWVHSDTLKDHFIQQGIKEEYLHEDFECPMKMSSNRWHDIGMWIDDQKEDHGIDIKAKDIVIIDDDVCYPGWQYKKRCVTINFDEGITYKNYLDICHKLNHDVNTTLILLS